MVAPLPPPLLRTLATALDAGMGLEALLEQPALTAGWPAPLTMALRRALRTGHPGEALRQAGLVDDGAAALVDAGADGGFLPDALRAAAELLEERGRRQRRLLMAVAYPVIVALAACVLLPLPAIVTGGVGAWARAALPGFLVVVGVMVVIFVVLPRQPPTTQQRLRGMLARLPGIGGLVVDDARSSGLFVLSQLLSAGMSVGLALPVAARASGLANVAAGADDGNALLGAGGTLTEALVALGLLDGEGRALLAVAEKTGTMDAGLSALARDLQRRARQRFLIIAGIVAIVVGVGVAVAVGVQIVRGFVGYVDTIDAITR